MSAISNIETTHVTMKLLVITIVICSDKTLLGTFYYY